MSEVRRLRDDKRNKGAPLRQLCDNILDLISGHIKDNNLTKAQIVAMKNNNREGFELLKENSPLSAKPYIDSITVDGELVSQQLYDELQLEYADFKAIYPDLADY